MLCFCYRCSACNHSSQIIRHEQTWTDVARVGFRHLICMFSLLMCQAGICGSPHHSASKAAFNSKHAEHSCVLWLRYSFVLTHFWSGVWGTYCPRRVATLQQGSKERVLIRGQQSAGGLFTLQCSSQFKGRSWQTFLERPLCHFWPLIRPQHSHRRPGRKQVVVKRSSGFLCTSSVSSLRRKQRRFLLDIVLSPLACLCFPAKHQTVRFFSHMCAAPTKTPLYSPIHSFTLSPSLSLLFKVFT